MNMKTPRLQLRWVQSADQRWDWECHYELVILLEEWDIRRDVYDKDGNIIDKLPREYAIPMKTPSYRSNYGGIPPCTAPDRKTRLADTPFRDGVHANLDSKQLGGIPVYVIAPDGVFFEIKGET